jgi:hypothetical protein
LLLQIRALEEQQKIELVSLQDEFHRAYESIKPMNLIKSTFFSAATSPDVKNSVANNIIGLATNYVFGDATKPIKKIVGILINFGLKKFFGRKKED